MNYTVEIRRAAKADIRAAALWYERQRKGLGRDFLVKVGDVILSLGQTPTMHQIIKANVRRALLKRFPYCVYYTVEGQVVQIIGVFHAKRDPAKWQTRIE